MDRQALLTLFLGAVFTVVLYYFTGSRTATYVQAPVNHGAPIEESESDKSLVAVGLVAKKSVMDKSEISLDAWTERQTAMKGGPAPTATPEAPPMQAAAPPPPPVATAAPPPPPPVPSTPPPPPAPSAPKPAPVPAPQVPSPKVPPSS